MNRLKGPELKMPELKTPAFLTDLYYDLRDRRLLPLVALVVVAIAAVPFLLGGDEEPFVPQPAESLSSLGSTEKTSKLTVVEATPGLRDYRKRLSRRSPTNPFKQRYTGLPAAAQVTSSSVTSGGEGGSSSAVSASEGSATEAPAQGGSSGGGGSGTGGGNSGGSGNGSGAPRLVQVVIDVQISHQEVAPDGSRKMSEPEVRQRVRPFTQLPGEKTPVVTPVGISFHTGKIFFLVSNEVKSLGGDFNCITRTPSGLCELLEIERAMLLEASYGPEKILYQFKVTGIGLAHDGKAGDNQAPRAAFTLPARAVPVLP